MGAIFGGSKGPSAGEIAAEQQRIAEQERLASEDLARKRKASQAAIVGTGTGGGDATESLRATLLGGA